MDIEEENDQMKRKNRLIGILALFILLSALKPTKILSEEPVNLIWITSQSSIILEANLEGEVRHFLSGAGPVYSFSLDPGGDNLYLSSFDNVCINPDICSHRPSPAPIRWLPPHIIDPGVLYWDY